MLWMKIKYDIILIGFQLYQTVYLEIKIIYRYQEIEMHRIYIVEDDTVIASTLCEHLGQWGYDVKTAENFKEVLSEFSSFSPHLVLLDIGLPFFNGYHWCNEIRKVSKVPVIFISSASDNMNMVLAMQMGADDFIAKPFDLNVLLAKIQALLRRAYEFSENMELLEHRGVILNVLDATVYCGTEKLSLTKNEFRILQLLMQSKGKILSRENLISALWENDSFIDDNTLTVNMTRIRKKLDVIGVKNFITTKKGIGYLIE